MIWEAFKPETEPTRTIRKEEVERAEAQATRAVASRPRRAAAPVRRAAPAADKPRSRGQRVPGKHGRHLLGPELLFSRSLLNHRPEFPAMRAEAQAAHDQITAAIALVRRFLDWDRAQRRLAELKRARRGSHALGRPQGGAGG